MMNEEIHPSELNIFQQYSRAVKLGTTTSRLKNKDWYRDALDLDVQIHLYIQDQGGASCYLHISSKNHYESIGELNPHQLENYEELEKFIHQTLFIESANRAKSLGIVVYLADEMSIASLGPEHQNPAELKDLSAMMIDTPKEVLEDKTVSTESHAWRLLPYHGAAAGNEYATAVAVSRKHENTLKFFREIGNSMNLPIRTTAISAPLSAIASLPWYSKADNNGTVAVLNYREFTLLGFFNHQFELMLLRYMPHSNGAKVPANIGSAVLATASAFELENPLIQILPVSGNDVDSAIVSLQSSMMGSEILLVDVNEMRKSKNLPDKTPIEIIATTEYFDPEIYPLAANETFSSFREEKWHLQDFLSPSREELEFNPSQGDMKLLKFGRRARALAALLLVGVVIYSGWNVWNKMTSPAWLYKPKESAMTADMLARQMKQYSHWENLLKERSKGWVSMELLTRMVPEDGSVILSAASHKVVKIPSGSSKNGLQKEWIITGFTNEKGLRYLTNLSTREGVTKLFADVATATGNRAYLPNVGKRDLTVTLKQDNNNSFNGINPQKPSDKLKYSFNIVITQTFNSSDDMAIAGVKTVPVTPQRR